jgi:hypothetical protein
MVRHHLGKVCDLILDIIAGHSIVHAKDVAICMHI